MPNALPGLATSRRGFLRLAGGTAALGALAHLRAVPAAALACAPHGGAGFFDADQREVLTQVVERIVDTGEPDAPRVRDTHAVATIDGLCASLDPEITGPLPALLGLVEWGPLLFEGSFSRFTGLGPDRQDAHLRGWMTSRFALRRRGFEALRNLAFLGWYSQEQSWGPIGYRGPLLRGGGDGGPDGEASP